MSSAVELPARLAPIIYGCTGHVLDADEKAFFAEASPAGFILFKKNCDTPDQVRALCQDLRESVGWHAPILIDQEGGRVQRLRPPHWPDFPAPRLFGDLFARDAGKGLAALTCAIEGLAAVQLPLGIDINCVPCLDVVPDGLPTRAIDDRSLGRDPEVVAKLGIEVIRASLASGMTPVMKHIPGHGRARVDSHHDLPHVDETAEALAATDWVPFMQAAKTFTDGSLWAMSAHIIFTALDPELPCTLSPKVIADVVRGKIGFDGLLLTDDLFMDALAPWGDVAARAGLAVKAGMDIALHCHGTVAERARAADSVGEMPAKTRTRMDAWAKTRKTPPSLKPVDTLLAAMAQSLGA